MSDNSTERPTEPTRRRVTGLRAAALAGVLVSAGAFGATGFDEGVEPVDGVQSSTFWPMGSTCCPEETE